MSKAPAIAAIAVALFVAAQARAADCPTTLGGLDLSTGTIPAFRAGLDAGRFTSTQLVQAYLDRIAALNRSGPMLRPVMRIAPGALKQAAAFDLARALGQPAFGPLAGIPVLLKDNLDTRDMATTAGAKAMLGKPPPEDAFLTAKLREAGAIIVGKTNLDEWATTISATQPHGFSDVGGQTIDPYTRGQPSGSSGGSAVAASSGLAASTVGTETSGSIIDPSLVNSAVGIKPTRGLISRGGVVPLLDQFDTPGPIDQNVTDAAYLLGQMTGIDPRDPVTRSQRGHAFTDYTQFLDRHALRGARIGLPKITETGPQGAIVGLHRIRRVLEAEGAVIVPLEEDLSPPGLDFKAFGKAALSQFRIQLNAYLKARGPSSPRRSFGEIVSYNTRLGRRAVRFGQERMVAALGYDRKTLRASGRYIEAQRQSARGRLRDVYDRYRLDAILVSRLISATVSTWAGYPTITVPAGYGGRHPYGLILTGRPWSEPKLIGLGFDFEQTAHAWRSPAVFSPLFAAACVR